MVSVADFARAVMAPGTSVLYLNEDKEPDGFDDLGPALTSGRPFAVAPRNGIIVLDGDIEHAGPWYNKVIAAMREIGCSVVRVGSGREGCEHAWIVGPVGWDTDDLVAAAKAAAEIPNVIRRDKARARPPMSPHSSGTHGELIEPTDPNEALLLLTGRPNDVPLNLQFVTLAREGDTKGVYLRDGVKSRGVALKASALAFVNADMDYSEWRALVLDPSSALGQKPRRMSESLRQSYLETMWSEARAYARENPPSGSAKVVRRLALLRKLADTFPWASRTGTRDRAVYLAMLKIAAEIYDLTIQPGHRRLAEDTNMESKTIGRVIERLMGARLIVKVNEGRGRETAIYSLAPGLVIVPNDAISTSSGGPIDIDGVTKYDCETPLAFQAGLPGLTRETWETYSIALRATDWSTVAQLHAEHPSTLNREAVLRRLRQLQALTVPLVERDGPKGRRWRAIPVQDWYRYALAVGATDERLIKRIDRHRDDRRRQRDWAEGGQQQADDPLADEGIEWADLVAVGAGDPSALLGWEVDRY